MVKQNISPVITGIIIAVVVVLLAFFGYRMIGSGSSSKLQPRDYMDAPGAAKQKQGN